MIVFELACPDSHRFEGWFASAGDFEGQKARGILTCPQCGSSELRKVPVAKIRKQSQVAQRSLPAAQGRDLPASVPSGNVPARQMPSLAELIDYALANTEDVGRNFPDEARRMYREETPARGIRGVASPEETRDLLEEGIPVLPLPIPPKDDWH